MNCLNCCWKPVVYDVEDVYSPPPDVSHKEFKLSFAWEGAQELTYNFPRNYREEKLEGVIQSLQTAMRYKEVPPQAYNVSINGRTYSPDKT